MARILCVGNATLDIVNRVAGYPEEDSEVRALSQVRRMGGNAANTAIVLAQLGEQVTWAGNLAASSDVVMRTLSAHEVDTRPAVLVQDAVLPTSYITLNVENGTRSIVHHRDLPEYQADDFLRLDLAAYDWVHFEGRAVDQLNTMVERARGICGLPVSLEVEKAREGIESLFGDADLLLFSRDYAEARGYADAQALLDSLPKGQVATCTWGEAGAWAVSFDGESLRFEPPELAKVVDTVGAGDAFNAAMIHALSQGWPMRRALQSAGDLATELCGREGLDLPLS